MNTQNTHHTTRQIGSARTAFGFGVAAAAIVMAAAASPASASHPNEGPAAVRSTVHGSVTTPCFMARTADRWPGYEGSPPRCTHAFGAHASFGAEAGFGREDRWFTSSHSNRDHWRSCFFKTRSFHAWEQVQVGTPRCDIR